MAQEKRQGKPKGNTSGFKFGVFARLLGAMNNETFGPSTAVKSTQLLSRCVEVSGETMAKEELVAVAVVWQPHLFTSKIWFAVACLLTEVQSLVTHTFRAMQVQEYARSTLSDWHLAKREMRRAVEGLNVPSALGMLLNRFELC